MRTLLTVVLVSLSCGQAVAASQLERYERAVRAELRDPASAQFRSVKVLPGGPEDGALCGEINAKNGAGGYTGFDSFYAEMMGPRPRAVVYFGSRVGLDKVRQLCDAAGRR